jgi:tetratricopeptide (TPR) repeat protein
MAPEQASGKPGAFSPATDVWALGAILYRLVTGRPPFDAATPLETVVQVVSEEPVRPSRLTPTLPRDLETICLKCLQKPPAKRYAGAAALADDLHRFLAGEPIAARPVGRWERGWKWARRHPAVAAAVAVVGAAVLLGVVGLAAGLAVLAAKNRQLVAARQMESVQRARAEAALNDEQKRLLMVVLGYYKEFASEQADDEQTRQRAAGAAYRVGLIETRLGRAAEGAAAFQHATQEYARLAGDFPAVPIYRRDLARCHNNLGILFRSQGKRAEAEAEYRAALDVRQALAEEFPDVPEYAVNLAGSGVNLGHLVRDGGDPAASLAWYSKAVDVLAPLLAREPGQTTARLFLRNAHAGRAEALDRLNRPADAAYDWDRAVEFTQPPERATFRAARARERAQVGQVAVAVAEVAELMNSTEWSAGQLYDLACVHALAAGKGPTNREECAQRAVGVLRDAMKKGYRDAAQIKADPDLSALRSRPDFQQLLKDLEVKK